MGIRVPVPLKKYMGLNGRSERGRDRKRDGWMNG